MIDFSGLGRAVAPNISQFTIGGILTSGGVNMIDLAFFGVGVAFMASLFIAAFNFIAGQGDPKKIAESNSRIVNSLLGLGITFAAFVIVKIAASIFNFGNLAPF